MKLILDNVKKIYGNRTVLDLEHVEFNEKAAYAVIGPNGSGKSTLLKLLAGIIEPDSGRISYDGKKVVKDRECRSIAWLPQKPYMFDMSVFDNIRSGIRNRKDSLKTTRDIIESAGLESLSGINARRISGGEAQKTAVLRTLVPGSEIVLLDEPATSIDISNMERIEDYIRTMRRPDSTLIITTHDPAQALRLADTILVLVEGKLVEMGPAKGVLCSSNFNTKSFLEKWSTQKGDLKC